MRVPLNQDPPDLEINPPCHCTSGSSSQGSQMPNECLNKELCPALTDDARRRRLDLSDVVRPRVTEMQRQREVKRLSPRHNWSQAYTHILRCLGSYFGMFCLKQGCSVNR